MSARNPSQALVFIHGWACSAKFWRLQQKSLARVYDLIFVDLPGHGKSESRNRTWSMAEFARDVLTVLETIGIESWVVAGHSMGGAVALELALLEPAHTKAVIGVDSFTYDGFYRGAPEAKIEEIVRPYKDNFPETVRSAMGGLFLSDADTKLKRWICDAMARSPVKPALASLEGLLRWDVDEALSAVSTPVKGINASAFLDPTSVSRLRPKLEIDEMYNVGHFLMLEDPIVFNEKLLSAAAPFLSAKSRT